MMIDKQIVEKVEFQGKCDWEGGLTSLLQYGYDVLISDNVPMNNQWQKVQAMWSYLKPELDKMQEYL